MANVASLPGIVQAAYAMPDAHWGYGFPIGGVAAPDPDEGGVASGGGVGLTSPAGCGPCTPAWTGPLFWRCGGSWRTPSITGFRWA